MRVDFDQVIHNFAGTPLSLNNEPASLKVVSIAALTATYGDETLTGEEKARRYELASAIHAGTAGPSDEEIALIKTLVGKAFPPTIVGPVFRMLTKVQPAKEYFDAPLKEVLQERAEAGLDQPSKRGSA